MDEQRTKVQRTMSPQRVKTSHAQDATELQQTIERYELIFQATHDILYDLDLGKGTVVWNEALYLQFGYKRSEPAGTLEWWTQHIHPDDAFRIENELTNWFDSGNTTWQTEYRFEKADGSYNYVRDRGFLQRAADGTPIRIIGSLLDITKQKELDLAKDEFISLVSHQLRTPLTVIRLYSEMLTNGLLASSTANRTPMSSELRAPVSGLLNWSVIS